MRQWHVVGERKAKNASTSGKTTSLEVLDRFADGQTSRHVWRRERALVTSLADQALIFRYRTRDVARAASRHRPGISRTQKATDGDNMVILHGSSSHSGRRKTCYPSLRAAWKSQYASRLAPGHSRRPPIASAPELRTHRGEPHTIRRTTLTTPANLRLTRADTADYDFWRDHSTITLSPVAAPSILGLFGFAAATFMVAANLAGW